MRVALRTGAVEAIALVDELGGFGEGGSHLTPMSAISLNISMDMSARWAGVANDWKRIPSLGIGQEISHRGFCGKGPE